MDAAAAWREFAAVFAGHILAAGRDTPSQKLGNVLKLAGTGRCSFPAGKVVMDYALRQATDDDYDFLYQLHVDTIREAVEATWGWDGAFQRRRFEEHWDPALRRIVEVEGRDVGVLRVEWYEDEVFLALIEIAPDWQGQGLGTALIRDVQAQAREAGLPLTLQVLKTNPRARRLYERLGFEVVEEREERVVMAWRAAGAG